MVFGVAVLRWLYGCPPPGGGVDAVQDASEIHCSVGSVLIFGCVALTPCRCVCAFDVLLRVSAPPPALVSFSGCGHWLYAPFSSASSYVGIDVHAGSVLHKSTGSRLVRLGVSCNVSGFPADAAAVPAPGLFGHFSALVLFWWWDDIL